MGWSQGDALSEFIFRNYRDRPKLEKLRAALENLAPYLEENGIAHGDIQLGNVMVGRGGDQIQLIDYDGMFVPEIASLGSSELGHKNFQHPLRRQTHFDSRLDRFSFISLDLALRALTADPSLYDKTKSDEDGVIFKANDFADPTGSDAFKLVSALPDLATDAKNLAAICIGDFDAIPSLKQFRDGSFRPTASIPLTGSVGQTASQRLKYISAYPVVSAAIYSLCAAQVGNRVELVGQILSVKRGITRGRSRGGKPYIHIDFIPASGNIANQKVRIVIWSEGLDKLVAASAAPDASWQGRWLSVTGVFDNIYQSTRYGYSSVSITVTGPGQMRQISEGEAQYRLGSGIVTPPRRNEAFVKGDGPAPLPPTKTAPNITGLSRNQQIAQAMQPANIPARHTAQTTPPPAQKPPPAAVKGTKIPFYGWILAAAAILYILSKLLR